MARAGVGGLLTSHLPNVRYLCGFTGSTGVLALSAMESAFVSDARYGEQAKQEVVADELAVTPKPLEHAARWLERRGKPLGLDYAHLTVHGLESVRKGLKSKPRFRLKDASGMVEALREIKDAEEIARMRDAVRLASAVFDIAVKYIHEGIPEITIAAEIEYEARKRGAEGMSFETIVAGGDRSALPHGRASRQALPAHGFVVLDFGVILSGYCSDMTRTVCVGKPSGEERRWYESVRDAQEAAIAAVWPGKSAHQVDAAARNVLKKAGFGRFFKHSTGHGVGLEIHERPRIARGCSERLRPGMVVTIEPGAYIPGKGGVRIEDMVVVNETGCEILTPTTKELIVV